jgi:hypothetical protein
MEFEGSSPSSQEPVTGPYSELDQSILFLQNPYQVGQISFQTNLFKTLFLRAAEISNQEFFEVISLQSLQCS